jgi:ribosome-associated heat shock protein Hsp15
MAEAFPRADKFLWAVRVFKTRALASGACRNGKVSISGIVVKASREIKQGDTIVVRQQPLTRTIKVISRSL